MDSKLGRFLMDLVSTVPHMEEDEFDAMLNNTINVIPPRLCLCTSSPHESIYSPV